MTSHAADRPSPVVMHLLDGVTDLGTDVRAHCSCGYVTQPHTDRAEALVALVNEHPMDAPVCELCKRERPAVEAMGRWRDLMVTTDPDSDDQYFACCTDRQTCHDLAR